MQRAALGDADHPAAWWRAKLGREMNLGYQRSVSEAWNVPSQFVRKVCMPSHYRRGTQTRCEGPSPQQF